MATTHQAMLALDRANVVKRQNTQILRTIRFATRRAGAHRAVEAVEHHAASMTFHHLLIAVRGIGNQTGYQMLGRAGINPTDRVNCVRITDRQRHVLIGELLAHGEGAKR